MDISITYTKPLDSTYGEYKKICKRFGRDYADKSTCVRCGHAFTDDETPVVVILKSGKAVFACYRCNMERVYNDKLKT